MANLNTYSDVTSTYLISRPIDQSRQLAMTNTAMGLMLPQCIKLLNLKSSIPKSLMSHCWSPNVGWNRRKSTENWKQQIQSTFQVLVQILSRYLHRQHLWLYEVTSLKITGLHHYAHWNKGSFWQYTKGNLWKKS